MTTATDTEVTKERLIRDFKTVLVDTEELLKATAGQTSEKITAARAKLEDTLVATQKRLADLEEGLVEKTRAAAQATDKLVHEHPWQAAGVAAAVGFLLGLLTSRRG